MMNEYQKVSEYLDLNQFEDAIYTLKSLKPKIEKKERFAIINLIKLIKVLQNIVNRNRIPKVKEPPQELEMMNLYQGFYQMVDQRNYVSAYELIKLNNFSEQPIWRLMKKTLRQIIYYMKLQQFLISSPNPKNRLKGLVSLSYFEQQDLNQIKDALEEKEKLTWYENGLKEILEFQEYALAKGETMNSLCANITEENCEELKPNMIPEEKFLVYLKYGAYIDLTKLLHEHIDLNFYDNKATQYLRVMRIVLYKLEKTKEPEKPMVNPEIKPIAKKRRIPGEFEKLIQQEKYAEAEKYEGIHRDTLASDIYYKVLLKFLLTYYDKAFKKDYKQYKEEKKRGDYEQAKERLKELKGFAQKIGLNGKIEYEKQNLKFWSQYINNPNFVKSYQIYEQAIRYFRQKDFEQSLNAFLECVSLVKNNYFAYYYIGNCYERLRDFENAMAYYEQSIQCGGYPHAYLRLGRIYYFQKDYSKSLQYMLEYDRRTIKKYHKITQYIADLYERENDSVNQSYYHRKAYLLEKKL